MPRNLHISLVLALLGLAICGGAFAQEFSPLSDTSGYAAQEMRRLYTQGIGTGYSVDRLNRVTQNRFRARVPNVGQTSAIGSSRLDLGATGRNVNKPFSTYAPAPTVSPYLNLFRDDITGNSDFDYNALVRPMLEQQRINENLQREAVQLNRRLQNIAAQPDFNPQGNANLMPTGHQTVFQYYGHFYPGMNQRRR